MSSRLNRMWLLPFLLLGGQAHALGLGDIRLSSALNQPLRAEIGLLSATPEELNNLTVQLASSETFARYELDRPNYLTRLRFDVVNTGRAGGNFVRVTSSEPISEPFVTFLVEANWSRGRLLREYTLLLDPPTFAPPPAVSSSQVVNAPSSATAADSGQIQRAPADPQPAQQPTRPAAQAPAQAAPQNSAQDVAPASFDVTPGSDLVVQRGETLWGISSRVRPDSRLTVNQTMLAIYEANPQAFDGNINRLRAGASLRIPSADSIFRIGRGDAVAEVQRQNSAWGGMPGIAPADTQPSLTLVPPDEEDDIGVAEAEPDVAVAEPDEAPVDEEVVDDLLDPTDARIEEIEGILDDQNALISIPDNELAALRAELAELRGEPPPDEPIDALVEDPIDDLLVDESADEPPADEAVDEPVDTAPPAVVAPPAEEKGFNVFIIIGAALLAAVLLLVWFMRRAANRGDTEPTGVWDALDADDLGAAPGPSTERLETMNRDDGESIVVVETQQAADQDDMEFMADAPEVGTAAATGQFTAATDPTADTGINRSIEDTFSSETAINLDQSDPIAEADFHMAYGLYDQAADLINGALAADPSRADLLAKLCEIYFVWGNRDAFVDAAGRMKAGISEDANPDWDKIVIMGQQIAGDHALFSGVSAEAATRAVDLSFDEAADDGGALDIDFAGDVDPGASDIIDLGADTGQVAIAQDTAADIDFDFGDDAADVEASATREMVDLGTEEATVDASLDDGTAEMLSADDVNTVESPTIEEQFSADAVQDLSDADIAAPPSDATAEINLDDLGLDIGNLDDTSIGSGLVDDDLISDLEDTAASEILNMDDDLAETGRNPTVDLDEAVAAANDIEDLEATGKNPVLDADADRSVLDDVLDDSDDLTSTGGMPSLQEGTGSMPALDDDDATTLASLDDDDEDTDFGIDTSLLDATGQTQILTEDMAVDTGIRPGPELADDEATMLSSTLTGDETVALTDDDATVLAPQMADDAEFDFAQTEALPQDAFSSDMSSDETGRLPAMTGGTDMDLDLDDLTAALKVSEVGDTVNQMRDDATVQQPRLQPKDMAGGSESAVTQALAPEEISGDLHDARTMTEVGTKLDLARAYVDMGDPGGARSILEEVLDEGDGAQKQQARQLLDSLPT